jgi:hypothetical protein
MEIVTRSGPEAQQEMEDQANRVFDVIGTALEAYSKADKTISVNAALSALATHTGDIIAQTPPEYRAMLFEQMGATIVKRINEVASRPKTH